LLPVHRGPELLPFAIQSVRDQQRRDFELLVICDGAPPATAECARRIAATDPRIQVFDLPKGGRNGELHRDVVLAHARGGFVCQIGDDDLWFPDHLDEMALLLEHCDFGNLTHTAVMPDGRLLPYVYDLAHKPTVERMLHDHFNFFGPTVSGYRLEAYRRLEERWHPAPRDIWTDLYMWRKFLRAPHVTAGTRHVITSLDLAAAQRRGWSMAQRQAETERYAALVKTVAGRSQLRADAFRAANARSVDQEFQLCALERKRYLHRAFAKARRILHRIAGPAA
jgi:glycosyltransferase involved in cell wall biosynthesis